MLILDHWQEMLNESEKPTRTKGSDGSQEGWPLKSKEYLAQLDKTQKAHDKMVCEELGWESIAVEQCYLYYSCTGCLF